MTRTPPSLSQRARGALLGVAAGAAAGAPFVAPLAAATARALREPRLDLQRLAAGWIAAGRVAGPLPPGLAAALAHLERHDRPPAPGEGSGTAGAIGWLLPVALAAFRDPRTLLSASYHAARLVEADEESAWAAVGLNVAAAQFLLGHGDFVADVIEALRVNSAPEGLLAAARRIPLMRPPDLSSEGGQPGPRRAMILALWAARHEPRLDRVADRLGAASPDRHPDWPAILGLLGARDGDLALPAVWREATPGPGDWLALADDLVARPGAAA